MNARTCFVTGYPGFIGRRLVRALYERYPEVSLCLLVQPRQEKAARADLARFAREDDGRVQVVIGDVTDMHLGLSSDEYRSLTQRVTDIFHLAAVYQLDTDPKAMRQVNVEGTRNVLELAADCPNLVRFNHMSTSVVSGDREGVIAEDELDQGQAFRSLYEETKFEAEKLVQQARRRLPVSIYRPGIVVGDSKTGEIDRFDGPYYLAILLVTSPIAVPLPLPGSAVAPLNVVPVDFVVDAVLHIAHDPRGAGKTFHLVDPNPMAARRVYEQIALRTGKKLPPLRLSYRIADKLLRMPLLERLVRDERAAIASVNHLAIFNGHNTLELLDGTGIRCPQLTSYLDKLVDFVERDYARRKERPEGEPHDALGGSAP
jgi:thioester reductase-like protein